MKKQMKKQTKFNLLSLLLIIGAILLGTDVSMAFADTSGAVADEKGIKSDLSGTMASAGATLNGGLADPEIDTYIADHQPYQFPLDTDMRKHARKVRVDSMEIEHYASAAPRLTCALAVAVVNNTAKTSTVKIQVADVDAVMFNPHSLVMVDIDGYDTDENPKGKLMLYVKSVSENQITVMPMNGKKNTSKDMYVPDIPANTMLSVCSNAISETQMLVSPDNYQPKPTLVYLQKSACNTVISDAFKRQGKKIPFTEQQILDRALNNYRRKSAKSLYIGAQNKFQTNTGADTGLEYVYTAEGVMHQLLNMYSLGDKLRYEDLNAIAKMQFTKYSANNEAEVYCGKNFMERLANIELIKHKDAEFSSETTLGIVIKAFKCSFGRLNFKYDPVLDDLGYEDIAVVLDIKNATYYTYNEKLSYNIDMKQGSGDARQASRKVFIETTAFCLKGFNSILVAPATMLSGKSSLSGNPAVSTVDAIADITTPTDGQIIYLTADDSTAKLTGGLFYKYSTDSSSWTEHSEFSA